MKVLQAEGRISNADLADRVGLSPSPCLRRVRVLEEAGVIAGYRARVEREAIGLGLTVFVEISVTRHSRRNAEVVERRLSDVPGAVSCHMVSGAADFLLELAVPDLATYERILTSYLLSLDEVADIRSNFSLRPVLVEGALDLELAAGAPLPASPAGEA